MSSYNARDLEEAVPLLLEVEAKTPHWVPVAVDDAAVFSRMIHWLVNSPDSPMTTKWKTTQKPTRKIVIEWRTPHGWVVGLSRNPRGGGGGREFHTPVHNADGQRLGRIRLRRPVAGNPHLANK